LEGLVNFKKLLVPVDYSEYSNLASRYALKIAHKAKADIYFFHASYSPAFDLIELTGNPLVQKNLMENVTSSLSAGEKERLEKFIHSLSKLHESKGVQPDKIHSEIRYGLAEEEIISFAEEIEPDLVIMGTRGKDKKENSLLGSITESVIKKLRYPVLAIPENYTFIGKKNLKKIAYLTDIDESDFLSIKKLMDFTNLMGMTIHCLHIGNTFDDRDNVKMEGLKNYFKNVNYKTKVECKILSPQEKMLDAIDDYIQENGINMISLTSRKRNIIEKFFRPNLTTKLFYHTNIPLLVFHS
jgi:nucleotide-binding universal stress UspA family protein